MKGFSTGCECLSWERGSEVGLIEQEQSRQLGAVPTPSWPLPCPRALPVLHPPLFTGGIGHR